MSEYAEVIDTSRLKELDEMTQSARITTQARLKAVRDVEQEASYLLDEASQLYETVQNMSKSEVAHVYSEELERYAELAEDASQLDALEDEALMAYGQTKGMDYRLEDMDHHIDTGYRHLDEDEATEAIRHNAYHAWQNHAAIEDTVERLQLWAEEPERFLGTNNTNQF